MDRLHAAQSELYKAFAGSVARLSELARSPHTPPETKRMLRFRLLRLIEAAPSSKERRAAEHAYRRATAEM